MNICEDCKKINLMCGQAFRKYECGLCHQIKIHPNTHIPKICLSCAEKKNICQRCEVKLK